MNDLKNERFEVKQKLDEFNFFPVNAEGWWPNGKKSWRRIKEEVESSHLFILILGEKYGWIPTEGPESNQGYSVTHLEFLEAKRLGIPILPFLKKLEYGTDSVSDDAKKRDEFRAYVRDWETGYFTTDFDLASDLANNVGNTILDLLQKEYYRSKLKERSEIVAKSTITLTDISSFDESATLPISIPRKLIDTVSDKEAILFAGSGVSISAGLPSALAIAQRFIQIIRKEDPKYSVNPSGSTFAAIATDLKALKGNEYIEKEIVNILSPPQFTSFTPAHLSSINLFDYIVTTNYDSLFEMAAVNQGKSIPVISTEIVDTLPEKAIIKLHGSISNSGSLLISEKDVFMLDLLRTRLWKEVVEKLKSKMVIVVGSSLHDPSIIRLFSEVRDSLRGYFIIPELWKSTPERIREFNLECIQADANTFMKQLDSIVSSD